MQSVSSPPIRLSFYVSSSHTDFEKTIKEKVPELKTLKINYDIFEDESLVLPLMSLNGLVVAGLNNISKILREILAFIQQKLCLP